MARYYGGALGVCLCTVALAMQGCSSDRMAADAAVDKAINSMEVGRDVECRDRASLHILFTYDAVEIARAFEKAYADAQTPARRAQVAATAAMLAHGPSVEAAQRLGPLAAQWLFDEDTRVASSAVRILTNTHHPAFEDLLARRLRQPCEERLIYSIASALVHRRAFGVIHAQLMLPRPSDTDAGAVHDWRNHVEAAVTACVETATEGNRLPADFGPALVALAMKDETLTADAVRPMMEAPPDDAIVLFERARNAATQPSSRLAWEAALIAVDDGRSVQSEAAFATLADAVRRYGIRKECWPEVILRTRWLAFAAVYCRDDRLLPRLWSSLDAMDTRDRAELLSVITWEFRTHDFSARTSTNRLLVLLGTIPAQQLREMMAWFPKVAYDIRDLASSSGDAALPESADREEMNKIAATLDTMAASALARGVSGTRSPATSPSP